MITWRPLGGYVVATWEIDGYLSTAVAASTLAPNLSSPTPLGAGAVQILPHVEQRRTCRS
ncbi:MAG: hypothetical protein IT175_10270 [Acidobacteria bacterium]|nr:hypothetical protein [Acidobacteriota bacterium]